jgi:hypothetical protein
MDDLTLDELYTYTLESLSADGVSDGPPERLALIDFIEANEEALGAEDMADLLALRPGDEWLMGGGAMPITIIRCVRLCPYEGASASECATIRERRAAGNSDTIAVCPIHGAWTEDA